MEKNKEHGEYFTDKEVSNFLVDNTIKDLFSRKENGKKLLKMLDPCCGDGIFIDSILENNNIDSNSKIVGIDIQKDIISTLSKKYEEMNNVQLINEDFFDVSFNKLDKFNIIVGNPPFIRYHTFKGRTRELALKKAELMGVKLNKLSSSWAPFIVHSFFFLERDGNAGFVLPAELDYALYAKPVIMFLLNNFKEIDIIFFIRNLFSDLNEETILFLGKKYKNKCEYLKIYHLKDKYDLASFSFQNPIIIEHKYYKELIKGNLRFSSFLIDLEILEFYRGINKFDDIVRLGDLIDIGIGYVTGNNAYFHLSEDEVSKYKIPKKFLKKSIRKSSDIKGIRFIKEDWKELKNKNKNYLLYLDENLGFDGNVREYIKLGVEQKINEGYKCRNREPWYLVPHVYKPDFIVTTMSGQYPKLVTIDIDAYATNTLHIGQAKFQQNIKISKEVISACWFNSLTLLSTELEGHGMGGGMLKLEPGEAKRVMLFIPKNKEIIKEIESKIETVDKLIRENELEKALDVMDPVILKKGMNLSEDVIAKIKNNYIFLQSRRLQKRKN